MQENIINQVFYIQHLWLGKSVGIARVRLCNLIRKERLATRRRVPAGPRGAAGQTVRQPAALDPSQGRGTCCDQGCVSP